MPSIHISDEVFSNYLFEYGNASDAKQAMKDAVEENAPDPDQ